jgi:hypothetical protein
MDSRVGVWAFDPEDAAFEQSLVKDSRQTVTAAFE